MGKGLDLGVELPRIKILLSSSPGLVVHVYPAFHYIQGKIFAKQQEVHILTLTKWMVIILGLKRAGHLLENDLFFDTLKVSSIS